MSNRQNQNEHTQKIKEYFYSILLIISIIPLFIINENNEDSQFLFFMLSIIFVVNAFVFLKNRFFNKSEVKIKTRLMILFSLFASMWSFLHCLFSSFPSLSFNLFVIINRTSTSISDLNSFNTGALSFFIANFTLLTISLIELLIIKSKIVSYFKYIYILFISICLFIILNYLIFFPNILIAKPKLKLIKNSEVIKIQSNQYWDLFYQGEKIESSYDPISYKWYFNGKLTKNGRDCELKNIGNYQAILATNYGDIKSEIINFK